MLQISSFEKQFDMWRILVCSWMAVLAGVMGPRAWALDHAQLIDSQSILYVYTPSAADLTSAWQRTNLHRLSEIPQLSNIALEFASNGDGTGQWDGVDREALAYTLKSAASFSIQLRKDGTPVTTLLFDGDENLDGLKSYFGDLQLSLAEAGWQKTGAADTAPLPAGASIVRFAKQDRSGKPIELALGQWQKQFCISTDFAVAAAIANRAVQSQFQDALIQKDAYKLGLESLKLPAPENIVFYCDPIELANAYQSDPDDGIDPAVIARRHGFGAMQGLAGKLAMPQETYDLLYQFAVYAPQPYTDSMQMLAFNNQAELKMPDWVPDYVHTLDRLDIDLTDFLDHLAGPFDDLVTEGTLEEILGDLKAADGPGVDLQADLFAHFGSCVFTIAECNMPPTKTSERTVLCIELKDGKKVADAIYRLLDNDPNSQRIRIPGQQHDLWRFGIQESNGASFPSSGLMVANDYLLLASNVEGIRKLILSSNGAAPRLHAAQDLNTAYGKLDALAGKAGFLRFFSRMDRDVQSAYELLRKGQTAGSESMYAQAIDKALVSAQQQGKKLPDFSSLPDFKTIEPYLGIGAVHGRVVEDGWLFTGFLMRK